MTIKALTTSRLTALAAAALCFGGVQIASAQTPPVTAPPAPAPPAPTAPAATAPAPTPIAAAPQITYSGLFDMYYMYQFNNPKHLPNNDIGTPNYNRRQNTPTLSLAELNIAMAPPAIGGFGFKATLETGDTANINAGGLNVDTSTNEGRFKNIAQLYATYLFKSGAGIDFGKFFTPFGYEVTESNANYNYSRSDVYSYLLPFYHTGFRAYTPNIHGFTFTGYIVNALNNTANEGVHDDNSDKAFLGQINYTDPKGKFVVIENIGYSRDKNVYFASNKTTLSDTDFTYTPDAKSTYGLNYVYRKDDGGSDGKLTWNGYAAYFQYQLTAKDSAALRYSYVDQKYVGRPWDITATYSIKTTPKFLTRFEYRYDHIYTPFGYADSNGTFDKSSQSTVTASEVFTF